MEIGSSKPVWPLVGGVANRFVSAVAHMEGMRQLS